jgi:hypothetical protein
LDQLLRFLGSGLGFRIPVAENLLKRVNLAENGVRGVAFETARATAGEVERVQKVF